MFGDESGAAAIGVGGGILGSGISYGLNKAAAGIAWDRQKDWATRGPTYMMKGLRDAGLNPILAATGGFSAGASRAPQASPATSAGRIDTLQAAQKKLLVAQTSAAEATAHNQQNQATLNMLQGEIASTKLSRAQWEEKFYGTEFGQGILRMDAVTKASPTSAAGLARSAGISVLDKIGDWWKGKNNDHIIPR